MALELNGTTGVSLVQDGVVTAADLAAGAITRAALPAGSVLQVVQGTLTTFPTTTSTVFVDTGLSASITPTSATSKILVTYHATTFVGGTSYAHVNKLMRDSTSLIEQATFYSTAGGGQAVGSMSYLDSPSTTSSLTYKIQFATTNASGVAEFNVSWGILSNETAAIILMEIAA